MTLGRFAGVALVALGLAASACGGGRSGARSSQSSRSSIDALAARFPLAALDDRALCDRLLARTAADHDIVVDPEPAIRRVVVVSDLHLGPGTAEARFAGIEDFYAGAAWTAFLADQGARGPTDLVIAGDFIDFWQIAAARGDLPAATGATQAAGGRVLAADQDASLAELAPVLAAHADVFHALGALIAAGDHRVVILAGNHDADLLWPRIQLAIARAIDPVDPARLVFVDGAAYEHAGVHVAHGHEYDLANKLATAHAPFGRDASGRCRLEASWGEVFVDKFYTDTERTLPFIDNLYPVSAGVLWAMRDEPDPARDLGAVLRFLELVRKHETHDLNREAIGGLLQEALGMPGSRDRGPESIDEVLDHVADQLVDGDADVASMTDALLHLRSDPALTGLWTAVVNAATALPDLRAAFAAMRDVDTDALAHLRALLLGDSLTTAATRILRERPGVSVVVFGHTHEVGGALHAIDDGGVHGHYANTGSWLSVASVADVRARGMRFADVVLDATTFPSKTTAVIVEYDGATPRTPVVYNAPTP